MGDIRIASGKGYTQFTKYVNLSKLEYNEIEFLETCMNYIVTIECMKVKNSEYIESIIELGCDIGYQMIVANDIELGIGISKENLRKRYIKALCNMLDYIKSSKEDRLIRSDELKSAHEIHKNNTEYDSGEFYADIVLLGSLTEIFKDKYKKGFTFISPNKYTEYLKTMHRVFYTMFIKSKFITKDTQIIINPLSGIADFIEYEDKRNFDYSILIDNTLYMVLVDSDSELNDDKWRSLRLKYKSLIIEKATEGKNLYLDYKLIERLAVYRAVNAEIEVMLDIDKLKKEAYRFYTTKEIVNILKSIEEPILSEEEFFRRLEN